MSLKHPPAPPRQKPIKPPCLVVHRFTVILSVCGVVLVTGGLLTWLDHFYWGNANDNLRSMPSPDGRLQAILFRRSDGEKESFTTHVSVIGSDEKLPNRPGNAFIAEGEPPVILRWVDHKHLVIEEPAGTEVIHRASRIGEIKIGGR